MLPSGMVCIPNKEIVYDKEYPVMGGQVIRVIAAVQEEGSVFDLRNARRINKKKKRVKR